MLPLSPEHPESALLYGMFLASFLMLVSGALVGAASSLVAGLPVGALGARHGLPAWLVGPVGAALGALCGGVVAAPIPAVTFWIAGADASILSPWRASLIAALGGVVDGALFAGIAALLAWFSVRRRLED